MHLLFQVHFLYAGNPRVHCIAGILDALPLPTVLWKGNMGAGSAARGRAAFG